MDIEKQLRLALNEIEQVRINYKQISIDHIELMI